MSDPWAARGVSRIYPGTVGGQSRIASPLRRVEPVSPFLSEEFRFYTITYLYTGDDQFFDVPSRTRGIAVSLASGADHPAQFATVQTAGRLVAVNMPVTPLSTLTVKVGGRARAPGGPGFPRWQGGWPDGGDGVDPDTTDGSWSYGGAGASSIWDGATLRAVAGAPGGSGGAGEATVDNNQPNKGGHGGDPDGGDGEAGDYSFAGGTPPMDPNDPSELLGGRGATPSTEGAGGVSIGTAPDGNPGSGMNGGGGISAAVSHDYGPPIGIVDGFVCSGGGGGGKKGGGSGGLDNDGFAWTVGLASGYAFEQAGGGGGSSWADTDIDGVTFGVTDLSGSSRIVISYYA